MNSDNRDVLLYSSYSNKQTQRIDILNFEQIFYMIFRKSSRISSETLPKQQKNFLLIFFMMTLIQQFNSPTKKSLKKSMSNLLLSESQSTSENLKQEEQPNLLLLKKEVEGELDSDLADKIVRQVGKRIKKSKHQQFELCIQIVVALLNKGYNKQIAKTSIVLESLMEKFTTFCKQIQNPKGDVRMLCVLSTIAELLKEAPPTKFSIKKGFLQNLLLIDEELVAASPLKQNILAVLAVIYECLSRQIHVLKKFDLLKQFRLTLLGNYSLIDQQFSLRLFNKALYNLATQDESITEAQLHKYNVLKTLERFVGLESASMVVEKLRLMLQKGNIKNKIVNKPNQMMAEV